jgi:hypothetical protein
MGLNKKGKPCGRRCAAGRQFCFGHAALAAPAAVEEKTDEAAVEEKKDEAAPAVEKKKDEAAPAVVEKKDEAAVDEKKQKPFRCLQCGGPKPPDMYFCETCKDEVRRCTACKWPETFCPVHAELMASMNLVIEKYEASAQ